MTIIRNAKFRILPPQPASPVSTGERAKAHKTARYRGGISWIALGLRVANWATEAPFRPLVSEADFWCLVFLIGKLRRSLFGGAGEQKAKVA